MAKNNNVNKLISAATLGPLAAAVKSKATPQQWRRLVKRAHSQGFTVDSFLDSTVPKPLKERTRKSLVKQAKNTVATAYRPAERQLTIREARVGALDAKRARDEEYYKDWLTSRYAELATKGAAADQQILDAGKQIQQQTADNYAQAGVAAANEVTQAGGVSNPAQSTALTVDLPTAAKHDIDILASSRQLTQDLVGSRAKAEATAQASTLAFQAGMQAKRQAETWAALQAVSDDRQKLALQRGTDAAQEISNLLNNEVAKAQGRQDNALVRDRLQLQADTLEQQTKQAMARLGFDYDKLAETRRSNLVMEALDKTANAIRKGNLDVAWYRVKNPTKPIPKKGSSKQSQFEYGYSILSASTFKEKIKGTKDEYRNLPMTPELASMNRAKYIGALVVKAKISRPMAVRVFNAYMVNGNKDPGRWDAVGGPGTDTTGGT